MDAMKVIDGLGNAMWVALGGLCVLAGQKCARWWHLRSLRKRFPARIKPMEINNDDYLKD